ncbi:hypothetical protein F0250_23230 [Vibrio cyclitrophicus]|uniref:IS66 family insertion sequence element accessory protein TnpA n=1 Tax=Vibrio cyclitrophicus TaxID=47951 RepID=UPI00148B4EA3|nr:hypothetical protein [Vibrio cyclitrophicus]NOI36784.1 hypothetical protein [Vibrio cyclitrophicus]
MSISHQSWLNHVNAWQRSNVSQAQYCRAHDINQAQFSYWKRKLNDTSTVTQSATSKFAIAQVETVTEEYSSGQDHENPL